MATIVVFANVIGLIVFLRGRTDRLLAAVVDPLHPDWMGMERAFAGFTVYAASLLGVLLLFAGLVARTLWSRVRRAPPKHPGWQSTIVLAAALTTVVVLVLIEVLLFQDYGIHFYEFDVFGILADAALRRDLGIQPAEVLRVTLAAVALLGVECLACLVALRLSSWRNGALPRAFGTAMLVAVPTGLALFHSGEEGIASDRAEFEGVLPFGRQLLLRDATRPFIAVEPRLGAGGYPMLDSGAIAPVLAKRPDIVFFVADGLRGDMIRPELTPNLLRFGARHDVIASRRHYSTGHVSEAGVFGLVYGLRAHAFNAFMEHRVPSYPLDVLRRNGYHTLLLASSRLSPYPTDQLVRVFDEVTYPLNDDAAIAYLRDYIARRRAEHRPFFVFAFMYTPHYPFTSAKPQFRRYPLVGPSARSNYMNDVLQADDYFRQTLDLVRPELDSGKAIVLATADHGEEIRDHGVFGHASATFWNEKVMVPFFLRLPGAPLPEIRRSPIQSSHVDVWPTVFDYLGAEPRLAPETYSDGRSLLDSIGPTNAFIAGRFFPYADKPSALIDGSNKYWFRASGVDAHDRLCISVTRVTDLDDRPIAATEISAARAFQPLQATFWRFVRPATTTRRVESDCR